MVDIWMCVWGGWGGGGGLFSGAGVVCVSACVGFYVSGGLCMHACVRTCVRVCRAHDSLLKFLHLAARAILGSFCFLSR